MIRVGRPYWFVRWDKHVSSTTRHALLSRGLFQQSGPNPGRRQFNSNVVDGELVYNDELTAS